MFNKMNNRKAIIKINNNNKIKLVLILIKEKMKKILINYLKNK